MYENSNRVRPRINDVKNRKPENTNHGFFLTGAQTIICILCLLTALGIRIYGGDIYKSAKNYADDALKHSITKQKISQVLKSFGDEFPSASEVFKNQTSSKITTSKPSSSSNNSSKASSAANQNTTSSTAAADPSGTGLKAQALTYQGGEDLPLQTSKVTSGSPAVVKTISYSPYKLSIKPITPVSGNISSKFGERINPITKVESFHTGIDIAAAKDTNILAAFSGTVESTGVSGAYGNFVLIDHGGGIKTFYGHCDIVDVKQGDKVTAGMPIAKVGSTGLSTGFHLHFEVRINGIYVNPQYCLAK